MNFNALHNGLLGWDRAMEMDEFASSKYQCMKLPYNGKVVKVMRNQWQACKCDEDTFELVIKSQIKGKHIMNTK